MENIYLTVVVPMYNEEKRILKCFEKIEEYFKNKKYLYEVIFVDDGCKDKTIETINNCIDNKKYLLLKNNINRGKGYSVKKGVLSARGEYILFMDTDMSTPIDQLEKLLPSIKQNEVVIGSRYLRSNSIKIKQPFFRRILGRLGFLAMRIILGLPFVDTQCGFKMFQNSAAKEIFKRETIDRWGFDMEILAIARTLKYKVKEVSVDWLDDRNSTLRAGQAAFETLRELIRIKINIITNKYKAEK